MTTWDRLAPDALARLRARLVAEQIRDVVAPLSPYWRERLAAGGIDVSAVDGPATLPRLPSSAEYDVCQGGDPAGAARLVLQPGEAGWGAAAGRRPAGGLLRRLADRDGYRRTIEADLRPTSYVFDGLALRFPVASTRADLDLVARAGARCWRVAGLDSSDVVVSAAPTGSTAVHQALSLAALAAGAPALFPGADLESVVGTLRLVPATVLAVPSDAAGDLLYDLASAGAPLSGLRTVLLLGAPDDAERAVVRDALDDVGARAAVPVAMHVAAGHRLPWVECRESVVAGAPAGLHTFPDLEVVETVDPETGGPAGEGPAEVAVTQLGMRGSALVRWRTGDLVPGAPGDDEPCPACGRRVPRLAPGLRRRALVVTVDGSPVDLRALAAALAADPDIADFRVIAAEGGPLSVGYAPAPGADADELGVDIADRVATTVGVRPARVVAMAATAAPATFTGAAGQLTPRVAVRRRGDGLG